MTWLDARNVLLDMLNDLGDITVQRRGKSSYTITVKRVYEHVPEQVNVHPSIICAPPGSDVERGPSLSRVQSYEQLVTIRVHDGDLDEAAAQADAIRQAVVEKTDEHVQLDGNAVQVLGPDFDAAVGDYDNTLPVVSYTGRYQIDVEDFAAVRGP